MCSLYRLLSLVLQYVDNTPSEGTWSDLHHQVNRMPYPSLTLLTPPRGDDPVDAEINARGPGKRVVT